MEVKGYWNLRESLLEYRSALVKNSPLDQRKDVVDKMLVDLDQLRPTEYAANGDVYIGTTYTPWGAEPYLKEGF